MTAPRLGWLALTIVLLGVVGCAQSSGPVDDPATVVNKFLAARDARSLDATMECFAEQPDMRSSLGVSWSGRDIVRAIMAYRLLDTYTVSDMRVDGNTVIWTENVRRGVAGSLTANFDEDVEAVVVGGRIRSMVVYVGGSHPALPSQSASQFSPSNTPALGTGVLVPLTILMLVAGAVLVWPPSTPLRPPRSANGQLLDGLREYVARRG